MANSPIVNPKDLKTSLLKSHPIAIKYDEEFDALKIFFDNPNQRSIVHYLDDNVALLFSPEEQNVIGIQVEAFEKTFIHKHTMLENAWRLKENCEDHQLKNVGDMMFFVQERQEKVAQEVQGITETLLFDQGRNELAYA